MTKKKDKPDEGSSSGDMELFNLDSIALLGDGDLKRDFMEVLSGLVRDCLARPSIKKDRKVALEVYVAPVVNQDGTCDDVTVCVEVTAKSPAKSIKPYRMRATVNGGLKYSPASPDDPDQKSLPFDEAGS